MRTSICLLVAFSLLPFVGCNSGTDNDVVIQNKDYNPINNIRSGLEAIEKSGRIGSGFGSLQTAVRDLKKVDAAKADNLEKELKDLAALSDATKVKAKAKEILGKL